MNLIVNNDDLGDKILNVTNSLSITSWNQMWLKKFPNTEILECCRWNTMFQDKEIWIFINTARWCKCYWSRLYILHVSKELLEY